LRNGRLIKSSYMVLNELLACQPTATKVQQKKKSVTTSKAITTTITSKATSTTTRAKRTARTTTITTTATTTTISSKTRTTLT
jgi:hypothetical protein